MVLARSFLCFLLLFTPFSLMAQDAQTYSPSSAISRALALVPQAPDPVHLQSFKGTFQGAAADWQFEFRRGETLHVVLIKSDTPRYLLSRDDPKGSDPAFWADVPPATELPNMDTLATDALDRIRAEAKTPDGRLVLRYQQHRPVSGSTTQAAKLHVTIGVEEDKLARRVTYEAGQFASIQPARLLIINMPKAKVPKAGKPVISDPGVKMPKPQIPQVTIPKPKIPDITFPVIALPKAELPQIAVPQITLPDIEVRANDEVLLIRLPGDVLFDFDASNLRIDAVQSLEEVLALLIQDYPDGAVTIHGHTDAKGSALYNMTLARDRATSVRDWFVSSGIDVRRMNVVSHGESWPIAPNTQPDGSDNPEGRQLNRRVEIALPR